MYPQAPRGVHQRTVRIERARAYRDVGQRHVDDPAVLPRDHAAEAFLRDDVDGMHTERRGEQPVAWRRRAAALHVAEYGHAGLRGCVRGEALREMVAYAAVVRASGRVPDRGAL